MRFRAGLSLAIVVIGLITTVGSSIATAAPKYIFPVTGCAVVFSTFHSDIEATDILAKAGCKFVAPINGVIDEVNRIDSWSAKSNLGNDRGGLYVSIIGDDGVRYVGSQLAAIPADIKSGVKVIAGRTLGVIGSTGNARGGPSHLHFGISWPTPSDNWWVRQGEVMPLKYLEAWRTGMDLSPVKEVKEKKLKKEKKKIESETLSLTLSNGLFSGQTSVGFATYLSKLRPADSISRFVNYTTGADIGWSSPTLNVSATGSSTPELGVNGILVDASNGLKVWVQTCGSSTWATATTCTTGTPANVIGTGPGVLSIYLRALIDSPQSMNNMITTASSVNHLKYTISLPDKIETTENGYFLGSNLPPALSPISIQGKSVKLVWTVAVIRSTEAENDSKTKK
ncbi:MAG: peptidase M23 [Actinobacteria bacterium]|jgi:hypothetical protein|nr:peptidase M23 [Actinomycetota bacterium]